MNTNDQNVAFLDLPGSRYENVKAYILDKINSGTWLPTQRVPSETKLVKELGVSRMTVHRAMRELTEEGVLMRAQGVGTFVGRNRPTSALIEVRDIADEIRHLGHEYSNRIIKMEAAKAPHDIALGMSVPTGASLFHSVMVHLENGIPVQLENRYVNPEVAPDYLGQDYSNRSPHDYLVTILPVTETENVIHAIHPDDVMQDRLEISEIEPCILIIRRNWTGGTVATYNKFIYPGSRFTLSNRYRLDERPRPPL